MTCDLVKISASGPMPTSRYCDHAPCATSTRLISSASREPGFTDARLSPMMRITCARMVSALPVSPRACSSITRSSRLRTKVTPLALIGCRSLGASSDGLPGFLPSPLFASKASTVVMTLPGAVRARATRSGRASNWLMVGSIGARSTTSPLGRSAMGEGPAGSPGSQARPSSVASRQSEGRHSGVSRSLSVFMAGLPCAA